MHSNDRADALFSDRIAADEWPAIHLAAFERFGAGARKAAHIQFGMRLDIIRDALRLSPAVWTDNVIGHILFGKDERGAGARLNKIKSGVLKLDEATASMLAGLINHILDVQPVYAVKPDLSRRALAVDWIASEPLPPDGEGLITARDLTGDILAMTARLARLVQFHDYRPEGAGEDLFHDELLRRLTSPLEHAETSQRLVVQRRRPGEPRRFRFGAEQMSGASPREWEPLEFSPGTVIEYGLPQKVRTPEQGWLVTVRDPRPPSAGGRTGPFAWHERWENLLRWLPSPFELPVGAEVLAPTTEANTVVDMDGLFHVFLLREPIGGRAVEEALGPSAPVGATTPDAAAYLRLLDALPDLRRAGVSIHASSYHVVGSRVQPSAVAPA